MIDEHRTPVVDFATDRTAEDDLPPDFPLPPQLRGRGDWHDGWLRFSGWSGAALAITAYLEEHLPATGYVVGQLETSARRSTNLTSMEWRSTRWPLRKNGRETSIILHSWVSTDNNDVLEFLMDVHPPPS